MNNPQGLHARPAHALVNLANRFESQIRVIGNGQHADGKSILSILTLAAEKGTELTIEATGNDARDALEAIVKWFLEDYEQTATASDNETSPAEG